MRVSGNKIRRGRRLCPVVIPFANTTMPTEMHPSSLPNKKNSNVFLQNYPILYVSVIVSREFLPAIARRKR